MILRLSFILMLILHVETVTADTHSLSFSFCEGDVTSCNYDSVSSAIVSEDLPYTVEAGTGREHKTSLYGFTAGAHNLGVETAPLM
jgi:hypothetical protein